MTYHKRLSSYAGMAVAATAGGAMGVDATADVVTFDVGVTISVSIGGTNTFITSSTEIQMEPLGVFMEFAVEGMYTQNSNSSGWEAGWVAFAGDSQFEVAKTSGAQPKVQAFGPGGSVGSNQKWNYPGGLGGKSFEAQIPDKSVSIASSKGVVDGQTYIGFRVMNEGFGEPTYNYGWFELDVSVDAAGASLTIERWGYETEVDTAASIPGGAVVPGPAGLFALAMGAAGIRGRRQRVA